MNACLGTGDNRAERQPNVKISNIDIRIIRLLENTKLINEFCAMLLLESVINVSKTRLIPAIRLPS